ncbi:MAG: hypothetical protein MI802_02315 [Desulfobacterales bacterium]|nr:hypothetical protein [Desulfobacterales bacterium]
MTEKDKNNDQEWEMLGHDPVPGYRTAFYISIVVSVIYLIIAFSGVFGGSVAH